MAIHPNSPNPRPSNSSKMPFMSSSKTLITITLHGHTDGTTYSTFDAIKGVADITVRNATPFTDLRLSLVGNVTTMVDAAGRSGALVGGESQATHQFLKLSQPIDLNGLGLNNEMLMPGAYSIPFTFVVPAQLLPRACSHRSINDAVREAHLKLPPTMGDRRPALGLLTTPDFSPEGAKIEYGIVGEILHDYRSIVKSVCKVRIVPAVDEAPPSILENISENEQPYILRKEKSVRKSMFGGKIGRIAVSASEPPAFKLPAADSTKYDPTTFVRLSMRFDPAHATDAPPSLSSVSSKLLITTAWATTARTSLPNLGSMKSTIAWRDVTSDALTDEVPLSPLTLKHGGAQWIRHDPSDPRSSVLSTSSIFSQATITGKEQVIISPTKTWNHQLPFYTASLTLPLSLPIAKHTWLPGFHSCLVSRTYSLALTLATSSTKVELIVPAQLSRRHTSRAQAALELADTQAQASLEAEEAFIARSTLAVQGSPTEIMRVGFPSVIGAMPMGNSSDRPPEYVGVTGNWNSRVLLDRRTRY